MEEVRDTEMSENPAPKEGHVCRKEGYVHDNYAGERQRVGKRDDAEDGEEAVERVKSRPGRPKRSGKMKETSKKRT